MTEALGEAAGLDAGELRLDPGVAREILDLARIASHASGERVNAPLLCYELGLAVGKGAPLSELAASVREHAESE